MDKIIIEYLNERDFEGLGYKTVSKSLEKRVTFKCKTSENFTKHIENDLELLENDTIVTIVSHSFLNRGIAAHTWESLITWAELIHLINSKKGNKKLILNLTAICNSYYITQMAKFCNHQIDEIWISTNPVMSISKALLAMDSFNFEIFHGNLDEDEKDLYQKL